MKYWVVYWLISVKQKSRVTAILRHKLWWNKILARYSELRQDSSRQGHLLKHLHFQVSSNLLDLSFLEMISGPVFPPIFLDSIVMNTVQYNRHQSCSSSGVSTPPLFIVLRKIFNYSRAFIGQRLSGSMSSYVARAGKSTVANIIRFRSGIETLLPQARGVVDKCHWQ